MVCTSCFISSSVSFCIAIINCLTGLWGWNETAQNSSWHQVRTSLHIHCPYVGFQKVSLCKHMLIFRILQAYFRITWQTSIVWAEPPMSRQQQIMNRHSLAFTLTMNVWLNFCCKTCWWSPPWPKGQMCGTADTASDTIVPCWNVWVKSQLPSFCSSFFNAHHLHGCPDGVMGTWLGLVQPQLLWEIRR